MNKHAETICELTTSSDQAVEQSVEAYVVEMFGNRMRKSKGISVSSSKHAVVECPGAKGGFDQHLRNLCAERVGSWVLNPRSNARTLMRNRVLLQSRLARKDRLPLGDSLYNQMLASYDRIGQNAEVAYGKFVQACGNLLLVDELSDLVRSGSQPVVHRASAIGEQGYKTRIITVPPSWVFSVGTVVRKKVFRRLLKRDQRLLPFEAQLSDYGAKKVLPNFGLAEGEGWLSADLTKATDGLHHFAVKAAIRGLVRAGVLDDGLARVAAESLGVGELQHWVEYPARVLTKEHRAVVDGHAKVVGDKIRVPLLRGIMMGTPLSFTILSLLNGWACTPLGSKTHICGDDVVSACKPRMVTAYANKVKRIGSGLHDRKSFYGTKGLTFCESFALADGRPECAPIHFDPYPIKQFCRDGSGVMDKGKYFAVQWSSMARVARTLQKNTRARARRLGRPPELPVALGGLGHPSKGMRSVPRAVRSQLYTLIFSGVDPSLYCTRVDIFHAPVDRKRFEQAKQAVRKRYLKADAPAFVDELPPDGSCFVPNRALRAVVSREAHQLYWAGGGKYRPCTPKAMKPGKLKLPPPGERQFSVRTPWTQVLGWYAEKLDREGRFVTISKASKIQGVNPPRRGTTSCVGPR